MVEETQCFLESSGTVQIPKKEPVVSNVEASLGLSEKWDAREAGREVAKTAIKNLTRPPDFFLLFSTIHYEKHGGFQEFLNGVWEVLPKGTPLIGGTVAGFMNNYGSYTHGATALAVSCPDMDVAIGYGKNTKRNPKKAARQSAEMIKKGLDNSKYENKFLLSLISGPLLMAIPGQGNKKVIDSGFMSKFITLAFGISQYFFQKGLGREDEVFDVIIKNLSEYYMLLGTSMDDYRGLCNYQFFNNKIFTNSVVNLGIASNLFLDVSTTHGMKKADIGFEITKLSKNKHIIHKINNKPARSELVRLLNWPEGFLNEKTMVHTILYYPISIRRHDLSIPVVMPFFLKNSIMTPCIIDGGDATILTVSGKNIVDAMRNNLDLFNNKQPDFGIGSACVTILQTLGSKTQIIQNDMLNYFKDKPFLMFWSVGEGTYSPIKKIAYENMSFNTTIFWH